MDHLFLDTLTKQYDRDKFKKFILEFFNQIDLSEQTIPPASQYSKHIDSLLFLGQFEDQFDKKIHVLEVKLKAGNKLEQARTMQRNVVAQYLKDHWVDGALVAFYSNDYPSWRLSLVKIDYKFDEKGKTKEELSPAKRYSFLVGQDEPTHTAQNQLKKIFEETSFNPTLDLIEEAFGVEKVTKEFFEKYRELFENFIVEFKNNHTFLNEAEKYDIDTENFAKKLLGQIVFLYFLQKKGWLGVPKGKSWGEGDKYFLRHLFDESEQKKSNFYNEYLEPLFYDTLNNPRNGKVDRNFSEKFNSKIPFLNGGLFEPLYDWNNTFIRIDNELFRKTFDVFDLYNFTVKEDEPLEKEVAVDPEMLGKVFENLIEENLRKGKGTYYTPREIVHYMCQESLINYLTTQVSDLDANIRSLVYFGEFDPKESPRAVVLTPDNSKKLNDALKTIKVVDPACGSGAFLVGMLQQIVKTRLYLSYFNQKKTTEYELKKETIQNSVYGVDIDPGAIEIAKLRLWLSLVVDYDLEEIEPLPNLDYKLMVGNSLIEKLDASITSGVSDTERAKLIDAFKEAKGLYFSESDSKKKGLLREQINEIIRAIVNYDTEKEREVIWQKILGKKNQMTLFVEEEGQQSFADVSGYTKQLEQLKDLKHIDHFEWHLNFNEVFENGGFDIVIANPPYGADIDRFTKVFARLYPNTTKAFKDIYKIFIELGLSKLLKQKGVLCYIIPNTLLLQPRYKDVRAFLLKHRIVEILNLGEEVFEQVVVPTCVIFIRDDDPIDNIVKFGDLANKSVFTGDLIKEERKEIKQNIYESTPDNIFVEKFRELKNDEQHLEEILDFKDGGINYQRVKVGLGEKGKSDLGQRLLYEGLQKDSEDAEYWKGEDIESYFIKSRTGRFVKLSTIKNLRNNERVILNKNYFRITPKLIWRQTASHMRAALDEKGIWFGRSIQSGTIKEFEKNNFDYKYLLALLNSEYLRHLYSQLVKEEGRVFPQVKLAKLRKLPIKTTSILNQKPFVEIVEKILAITSSSDYLSNAEKQARVKDYEKQIDQMVYKLYELTAGEIEIIVNNGTQ